MAKVKQVLFIDDGDIGTTIEQLAGNLKTKGYELVYNLVDLSDAKFKEDLGGSEVLSFDAIKGELTQYLDMRFDLVASDFDFGQLDLNGFDVVRWLKNSAVHNKTKLRRAKFVFYSSEEDKVGEAFKGRPNDDVIRLIKLRVDHVFDRLTMADTMAAYLIQKDEGLNLSDFIRDQLRLHPEMKFQSTYNAKFFGKSFEEIAHDIDKESAHGVKFQENVVELAIAHLVDMNHEE